jgi:hypothetical protein
LRLRPQLRRGKQGWIPDNYDFVEISGMTVFPFGLWTLDFGLEKFKRCRYEGQDEYGKGIITDFSPSIV